MHRCPTDGGGRKRRAPRRVGGADHGRHHRHRRRRGRHRAAGPRRGAPSRTARHRLAVLSRSAASNAARTRFLVLIPAHDEERVIGACLAAIAADRRPGDHVLVVADRCTDTTAEIARAAGAPVLERGPGRAARSRRRPPGRARARAPARVGRGGDARRGLDHRARASSRRASARSARAPPRSRRRSESAAGRTLAAEAGVAAFTLQGVTMPRGRDRLGLPVRLRGTGMAIRREVALAHRFTRPGLGGPLLHARPAAQRPPLPARRARPAPLAGRERVENVRRARRSGTRRGGCPPRARSCRGSSGARSRSATWPALEMAWFLGVAAVRARPRCRCCWRRCSAPSRALGSVAAVFGAALVEPRAGHRHGPDPGPGWAAHVARAARRALVHRLEGRRAAACSGARAAPRRVYGPTARV